MNGVKELGYFGITASDLPAWEHFAVEVLGLARGEAADGALALRLDDRVHRMIVEPGASDDMQFIGYDCGSDATLEAIAGRLREAGHRVEACDETLARRRAVRRLHATRDPAGNRVELYVALARADMPFESALVSSGFCTASGGAGHAFMPVPDRQPMIDFYTLIGFRMSDFIVQEVVPGTVVDAAFMHCNPRHHTVAFAQMPGAKAIHHFMIEVNERVDVGCAYDRVMKAGIPLEATLGMHPNDRMFSFYVTTPSGFAIEFGADGRLIEDDDAWEVTTHDRLSTWGHSRPAQVVEALSQGNGARP